MARRKRNSQPEPRAVLWDDDGVTHGKVMFGHATIALVASADRGFVEAALRYYNEPMRGRQHLAIVGEGSES